MKSMYLKIILVISIMCNVGLLFYSTKFLEKNNVEAMVIDINAKEDLVILMEDKLYNNDKELLTAYKTKGNDAYYKLDKGIYYHVFIDSYSYKLRVNQYEAN